MNYEEQLKYNRLSKITDNYSTLLSKVKKDLIYEINYCDLLDKICSDKNLKISIYEHRIRLLNIYKQLNNSRDFWFK